MIERRHCPASQRGFWIPVCAVTMRSSIRVIFVDPGFDIEFLFSGEF